MSYEPEKKDAILRSIIYLLCGRASYCPGAQQFDDNSCLVGTRAVPVFTFLLCDPKYIVPHLTDLFFLFNMDSWDRTQIYMLYMLVFHVLN